MALLELREVAKHFGAGPDRQQVLQDIHLDVSEGEFVAVVGYSGAGKTTLISMIAGLLFPDHGSILLDGKPILGPGADRGVVFQNYSLLPWLTAYENVALAVDQVFADWSPDRRNGWVEQHLEMVKLLPAAKKRPHELSGGMRQRVSVARALAMSPRILLLDEPFGALDALTRANLQNELTRIFLTERKTAILITNDVDEALLLADRVIPLSAGPAATFGPAVEIPTPRPRDRGQIGRDPDLRAARNALIGYLTGPGRRNRQGCQEAAKVEPALAEAS
jgi:nitrate/nitrite transport system ATP-binding protein